MDRAANAQARWCTTAKDGVNMVWRCACGAEWPKIQHVCEQCYAIRCWECGTINPAGGGVCQACRALLLGTLLQNRYRVMGVLGGGGFGTVFWGESVAPAGQPRVVAIKEMSRRLASRLQRHYTGEVTQVATGQTGEFNEAVSLYEQDAEKLAHALNHPGIPKVYDHFQEFNRFYMVMEFIEGKNLRQVVDRSGPISERRVLDWGIQLCDILTVLHSSDDHPPIIHRDISPDNIMLTQDDQGQEQVKLIDFGIARFYRGDQTRDSAWAGKRLFGAPEQWREIRGESDARTDLFSLGATLYYLLTDTNNPRNIVPHKNVSPGTLKILKKATAYWPHKRYQSAEALRRALVRARLTLPSSLSVRPARFAFGQVGQGTHSLSRLLRVQQQGKGQTIQIVTDKPWLQVKPISLGADGGRYQVQVDTTSLDQGRHHGWLIVSSNGDRREIEVSIEVTAARLQRDVKLLVLEGSGWLTSVLLVYLLGVILPVAAGALVGLLQIGLAIYLYDGQRPLNRQRPALYGAVAGLLLLFGMAVRALF